MLTLTEQIKSCYHAATLVWYANVSLPIQHGIAWVLNWNHARTIRTITRHAVKYAVLVKKERAE